MVPLPRERGRIKCAWILLREAGGGGPPKAVEGAFRHEKEATGERAV
jgi:hypothetical protein